MEPLTASDVRQMLADASTGTYGCFEYQGCSLGFYSDEADLLDWFGRFFGGYFTVTTSDRTDALVYSSRDPALFQRLKECATSHGRRRSEDEIEYVIDAQHRIVYRSAYRHKPGEPYGRQEENCFVLSEPGRKVLVSSPDTFKGAVKRALRNMMKLLLMEKGWLALHSATCIWNDTGICILGGKFAGKTSTLVNLLNRPGARLVSNDNLFVRDGGVCLEGCGFPNGAGLRIGALVAYPKLVGWIEEMRDSFYPQVDAETFHEIVARTPADELRSRPERIRLLPTELAGQLDVPIQHVAAIELFLVVQFDPSLEQSRLVPVEDPQQVREYLAVNVRRLSQESLGFLQSFFDFDDDTLQARFDALLEKFTSRVAVQELYQNMNTNDHSADLVREFTQRLHVPA